ncbi:SlyX family protein [Bacteriovorax sp. Seq25_V]|uniref:SlyX family protein n=1 Tax=Bacteriovorax sp. Seq25_V TaxID=1201288 RepID=UPI00038A4970|nr:SlyX family protein [Bacteriovorax sp. Seq25_V]EQC47183.1 SlyX family protein [Bacteriovorax sp. Seq25_V]
MNELEQRLSDLEVKFSYQDDMLAELSLVIADQQKTIDQMRYILEQMSEQQKKSSQEGQDRNPADDKPPHY